MTTPKFDTDRHVWIHTPDGVGKFKIHAIEIVGDTIKYLFKEIPGFSNLWLVEEWLFSNQEDCEKYPAP